MDREAVVRELVALVDRPGALVAIDGPDCAGKTMLADELAGQAFARGRCLVRVSIDGFHRPAAERRARGALSPIGYVDDSFDLAAFRAAVLEPLAEGGSRRIVPALSDWRIEGPAEAPPIDVPAGACVLVDGVFLLRSELAAAWSASVFVFASADVVLDRARVRDADAFGGPAAVERRYLARYLPGQALYLTRERPHERATVCVENSDPAAPVLSADLVAAGVAQWVEEHGGG